MALDQTYDTDDPPQQSVGAAPVLQLRGVGKQYSGVWVVDQFDLHLDRGEIHALCGENGAGKSTLVKAMAGVHLPDRGEVIIDGRRVEMRSAAEGRALGISVLHQHPELFPDLDVAENIMIVARGRSGLSRIDYGAARGRARELLSQLGVSLDPRRRAGTLALADQQLAEIAVALSTEPRILILDEPTASLTTHEVDRLFSVVRELRNRGVAVMIVNHRMSEVFAIADRVTVIRDGRRISTEAVALTSPEQAVREMVGRSIDIERHERTAEPGEPILELRHLSRPGVFRDVNITVHSGEIVGLAGLVGAGRTEIARAAFGIDSSLGEIVLDGQKASIGSSHDAMALGIAYVPEDRHAQALALTESISRNITLPLLDRVSTFGVVRQDREAAIVEPLIARLAVVCRGPDQKTGDLSGGNQQKVVLAKWLATSPRVLLLDEPTFGVDVGAQAEIHRIVNALAASGLGILLISSDLIELRTLSDRILVVHEGQIVGEYPPDAPEEMIMAAAVGAASE